MATHLHYQGKRNCLIWLSYLLAFLLLSLSTSPLLFSYLLPFLPPSLCIPSQHRLFTSTFFILPFRCLLPFIELYLLSFLSLFFLFPLSFNLFRLSYLFFVSLSLHTLSYQYHHLSHLTFTLLTLLSFFLSSSYSTFTALSQGLGSYSSQLQKMQREDVAYAPNKAEGTQDFGRGNTSSNNIS